MTQLLHVAAACAVLASAPGDKDADIVRARDAWHACVRENATSAPIESAFEQCERYVDTVRSVYHFLGVRGSQVREMIADNKAYLRCKIGH